MTSRCVATRLVAPALFVTVVAGCADDGPARGSLAARLCPTVQAWSDATVDAVNGFRIASRTLDPDGRRARYEQAFDELSALHDRLADALDDLPVPGPADARLDQVLDRVAEVVADGAAEAAALPDSAYAARAVADGSLVTGVEKAKAIVFAALGDLAHEPGTDIPRGCGRRGALDLSPSATFPP